MTQAIVQTNLDELLADCGTIDAVSWQAPKQMTYAQWAEIGSKFQYVSGSLNWWLGDWLNEGEKRYGETYAQAVEMTGHKEDHLIKCKQVAGSVQKWTRVQDLSWTHHRYVSHLPDNEQGLWLNHALAHSLSSRELKQALEQANAQRKPLPQPDLNWMPEEPKPLPLPAQYTNGNGASHHPADNTYEQLADDLAGDEDGYDWTKEELEDKPLTYFDGSPVQPSASMAVHYSSEKPDWETPQDLFDLLNEEFNFTLDVCAVPDTAKCTAYFTPEDDGLAQDWTRNVCWMNPPYGDDIPQWMNKAHKEARRGATVVCLVPARVDTAWWWDNCIYGEIRFLKGRLKFKQGGNEVTSAPFPSAVIVLSPNTTPTTVWWDWKKQCTDSKNS